MLGSYFLKFYSDSGCSVLIIHLVLDGASRWVIRKNVTQHSDILHNERNALKSIFDGQKEYISLTELRFLTYTQIQAFFEYKDNIQEANLV